MTHREINQADYRKLHQLLAGKQWQLADLETRNIMLRLTGANQTKELLMTRDQLLQFPCQDLEMIDKLWRKYSQGKFGFTVINQIYIEMDKDYQKLAEKVGWYREGEKWISSEEIDFTKNAPQGHLPITWVIPTTFGIYWLSRFASAGWRAILERITECQL
jgi:GUN4-like